MSTRKEVFPFNNRIDEQTYDLGIYSCSFKCPDFSRQSLIEVLKLHEIKKINPKESYALIAGYDSPKRIFLSEPSSISRHRTCSFMATSE